MKYGERSDSLVRVVERWRLFRELVSVPDWDDDLVFALCCSDLSEEDEAGGEEEEEVVEWARTTGSMIPRSKTRARSYASVTVRLLDATSSSL